MTAVEPLPLVVDLAKACQKVHLGVIWKWAINLTSHEWCKGCSVATLLENVSEPMEVTITAILLGSNQSVLLVRINLAGSYEMSFLVFLVYVDHINLPNRGSLVTCWKRSRNLDDTIKAETGKRHL